MFYTPLSHPDAAFVAGVAFSAAEIILDIYSGQFDVEMKAGEEPVTVADKKADDFIVQNLKEQFPKDRIFSEENGLYEPENFNNRIWYIDPIDGTREFIKKNGEFAIQIGLAVNGKLEFGLVLQPVGKNLYIGAKREGCHWHNPANGWTQLRIPERGPNELIIAMSKSKPSGLAAEIHAKLEGTGLISRGGVGLKLMAMAKGEAHYYLNDSNATKAWDMASPELLFTEAGGVVTDLKGNSFSYLPEFYKHKNGLLATCNKGLHNIVLAKI
jgi:3'(2'), 5'-bisphosphate nucleotidase